MKYIKYLLFILLLFPSIAYASAYDTAVLIDTPLGYWKMNESSGSTTLADSSGHGNNCTTSGTVTLGVTSLGVDSDTVASFAGTGHLACAMPAPSGFPVTIEFVMRDGGSPPEGIFDSAPSATSTLRQYSSAGGPVTNGVEVQAASNSISFGDILGATHLYDIIFDLNGGARRVTVYRDTVLVSQVTGSGSTFAWTNPFQIGSINSGNTYSGKLQKFAVYGTALSTTRIDAHFSAIATPFAVVGSTFDRLQVSDGAVAAWPMNDASGSFNEIVNGSLAIVRSGSPTYGVTGGSFDGEKAITFSSVEANGSDPTLNFIETLCASTPCTIEFAIKSTTTLGIFDTIPNNAGSIRNYNTGQIEWISSNPLVTFTPSTGVWHLVHIVLKYVSSNRTILYYLDGSLISTSTGNTAAFTAFNAAMGIGDINNSGIYYAGSMQKMAVYPLELTQAKVTIHESCYLSGICSTSAQNGIVIIGQ